MRRRGWLGLTGGLVGDVGAALGAASWRGAEVVAAAGAEACSGGGEGADVAVEEVEGGEDAEEEEGFEGEPEELAGGFGEGFFEEVEMAARVVGGGEAPVEVVGEEDGEGEDHEGEDEEEGEAGAEIGRAHV